MISSSSKIEQILAMVQELSPNERVGLVQRIMQMFIPAAEREQSPTNGAPKIPATEPYFSVHPQRHLMLQEQKAFDSMLEELRAKYLGLYVAVHKGVVVDHDDDITALSNRAEERYPDKAVLIRQVLSGPEPELRWRSVRLMDNAECQ